MLCPRCGFDNGLSRGKCARCGSEVPRAGELSGIFSRGFASTMAPPMAFPNGNLPTHADVLPGGRYRLMRQMNLPEIQRRQGRAWSALDLKSSHRRVVIRELIVPEEMAQGAMVERAIYLAVQRLKDLGQHPGFPKVLDFFVHGSSCFLVSLYPEGESLASLLYQQGGALSEQVVAEYGYQICGLLALMANQQPPLVHGSISPDTLLVSEDKQDIYLVHIPPFKPDAAPARAGQVSAGYYAPEQLHSGASPSSDLYALAVTLHHAVTGYDPRSRLALFHPPARRLNPAITPQMEMILTRQLSLSPSRRYTHPSEMQKDLAALLELYPDPAEGQFPMQAITPPELSEAQLREQRHSTMLLNMGVFAAICVLVLVGVIFAILR